MKKGIYTWFGIPLQQEECYSAIKAAGFDAVMVDWSGDFTENIAKEKNISLAKKYSLKIENGHLSFANINSMWDNGTDGDQREKTLKEDIVLAGECGVPVLVIHTSGGPNPPPLSEIGLKRFGHLIEAAEKSGVKLAFENLRFTAYNDAVFERFSSPSIGFCYDIGHRNCRTPNEDLLKKYSDKVIAIHLHDNDGFGDQHLLPFEGTINWQAEMQALAETSYRGSLTLESASSGDWEAEAFLKTAAERTDKLIEMYNRR